MEEEDAFLHREGAFEHLICQRDAIHPLPPVEVPLFRILIYLGEWTEDESQFGYDKVKCFLIQQEGHKKIMLHKEWHPAPGYSAGGAEDALIELPPEVKL